MKNIYCFLAGLFVAFVLLRGWQPPVGRYEIIVRETGIAKADTATGRIWLFHGTSKQWADITNP